MVLAYFPQKFLGNLTTNTNFPPQSQLSSGVIPNDWFNTAYKRRVPITINGGQITNTHTDFPFLFNSLFSDIEGGNAKADGGDIRFALQDKTELKSEIQFIDVTGGNGELIAWTKVPSLQTATSFFMYYDNPAASLPTDPENVWTNYRTVWHLKENPSPVSNLKDSTTISSIKTTVGEGATSVTGQIGKAIQLGGGNFVQTTSVAPTSGWLSVWVNVSSTAVDQYITSYLFNQWSVIVGFQDGFFNFFLYPTNIATDTQFPASVGVFAKIDVVVNGQNQITEIYKDGVLQNSNTDINNRDATVQLAFGSSNSLSENPYTGIIDEFRLNTIIPANIADRVLGEYNNQNAPNSFYTIGPVETIP